MIRKDSQTKTEHSVLAGGVIELNCQTFGDPKPIVEWILPDGSKLRAPYNNEDQRIVVAYNGRLIFKSVEISDTGVYHCIATNSLDVDVLAFRVTVLPLNTEEQEINGIRISHTLGQNLCLDCTSASSPEASIQWILPDHTILDKSYGNRKLYRNGTLVIHGLTSRDKGFYRCLVGNFLGADLLASHVTVHGDLSNSTEPKESAASFTVLSNSDAFLPCEATGNPEPIISWNRLISTTGKMGKFEVLKNGTLFIQKANIKDQGQYICFAQNEYGSDKFVVTLSVVAYPTRILEKKMRDIKVLAGKTVHLECRTDGRPVPMVSWIPPNHTEVKLITEHGRVSVTTMGTLTIQEVSVLDSGHYKCIASNPAGTDTATVRLQVVAAPPVILEEKQQLVSADIGQNLFLACSTYGDPQPTTYWVLHDGTIVRPLTYSHTKVSVFGNGTLYLRDVQITESGKYECIATSSTGSEWRVVTLSVKRTETVPQITETSQQRTDVIYAGRLQLNCSAVGDPKPQIIWRMGSRIKVLENGTLIIESVNEKDAGDFICVARNKVGDDVQLIRVSMSMKPARIKPNVFSRKKVTYGNDLKVDCVAAGVPMPEISWGLPDGTLVNSGLQADGSEGDQFKQYTLFNNGTLYLNKVGSDEEGDYTCYAENKLGKDKMHVHISVVTAVPRIQRPILSYAKVKPGRNVRFDCKAIGDPKPNVFWMLPSKDIIAASNDR
uniref:Immunoglobulin superfamily, member 10 n=1 Tax=Sinocyclocheilus grahami TaxID=75366 RepID=A0A672NDL8_SINGR